MFTLPFRFLPSFFGSHILRVGLAFCVLAICSSSGFAQEQEQEVGLNGIIGEPASPELDTQFLAMDLPESWKEWAEGLDEEMLVYFFPEELDVKGQRELVAKLRTRLATMKRAIADPRYQPIRDRLLSLAGPLERHLDLSTAILDALDKGIAPVPKETKQTAFLDLREAVKSLEALLAKEPNGASWSQLLKLSELDRLLAERNTPTEALKKRLDEILDRSGEEEEYTADQLRVLRSDAFWQFHKSAARVQAILAWEKEAPTKDMLRDTLRDLAVAVVSLDVNQLVTHSQELQLAWDKLVLLNPANASNFAFLQDQYYSDNMHTFVSEGFMKEIVQDRRTDSGQVHETIMGAQVSGHQVTNTETTVDLVPSPEVASMVIRLKGDIRANTQAQKSHIKVYTQGSSQFWAAKQVQFDGFRFQSRPAEIAVNADNMPYGAETIFSCLPVLGNCVDRIILDQAIARKGEAESIARQKVADRVVPELNKGINEALTKGNDELTDNTYRRLRNNNLYPVAMKTATTETHFLSDTMIRNRAELGGGSPPMLFNEQTGANFHIHESLLNNTADRMHLAGRTMTDQDLRDEIERFIFSLTGREVTLEDPEPMMDGEQETTEEETEPETGPGDRFVFDKITPLRFQIKNNEVQMTVRTALLRSNGELIPPHDIMIPFRFVFEGDDILITKGRLAVNRADMRGNPAQNLVMGKKIGDSIPDGRRSRLMTMNLQDEKTLTLRIERIKALNGWLSLWALPTDADEPAAVMDENTKMEGNDMMQE